ncbi:MAG: DUF6273 domain-containing protein [Oscillospiraceae bacterium]|nr:DUF6273 domain-containing protein [Oscillospiraceae bacterium]
MKKLLSLLLTLSLILTFAACDTTDEPDNETTAADEIVTETTTATTTAKPATTDLTPKPDPIVAGGIIQFGEYDWRILEVRDDRILIITDKIISKRNYYYYPDYSEDFWFDNSISMEEQYNRVGSDWSKSDIREWLNDNFYNSFNQADRQRIFRTKVTTGDNLIYHRPGEFIVPGGLDTIDHIFLLSIEEVLKYFGDSGQYEELIRTNEQSMIINDQYNDARDAYCLNSCSIGWCDNNVMGRGGCWWWLRSPGFDVFAAATVEGGLLRPGGHTFYWFRPENEKMHSSNGGIRPALWLSLSDTAYDDFNLDETPEETTVPDEPEPATVNVGDIIQLGGYDWRVLDVQGDRAFILTDRVIANMPYNVDKSPITWEESDIYKWLNNEFYNRFNSNEKAKIHSIALLSVDEANKYFTSDSARTAYDLSGNNSEWWLRSPKDMVGNSGRIFTLGGTDAPEVGVRPAMWITI